MPLLTRKQILANAQDWLGLKYAWGGFTKAGLDCSAYVSRAWGLFQHFTTDTIQQVSTPIGKEDLQPGDALNLPTWDDPQHFGHMRLFGGWANDQHTAFTSYEATDPLGSVKRVVAWDDRYHPIRFKGVIGGEGADALPVGTPGTIGTIPNPPNSIVPNLPSISLPNPAADLTGAINRLGDSLAAVFATPVDLLNRLHDFLAWLGQENVWLRIGLVFLGATFVLIGLVLFGVSFVPKEAAQAAAAAAAV